MNPLQVFGQVLAVVSAVGVGALIGWAAARAGQYRAGYGDGHAAGRAQGHAEAEAERDRALRDAAAGRRHDNRTVVLPVTHDTTRERAR
jgi:hypothetical protein